MYHPPPDTTRTWDELFQALVEYKIKYGTVVVPENFVVDPILGKWVAFQRRNRANLEPHQRQKLESLGIQFVRPYKPRELRFKGEWEDMHSQLVEYIRVKTNGAWPKMIRGNPPLANWVRRQRDLRRERKLSESKIERLNKLGMIWKTEMQEKFDNASKEEQWMMQYSQLKKFYEKHGHSKVPARYLKDMTLGEWVRTQRKMWKMNSLKPHRKALLDRVDFVYLATPETGYISIKQETSQKLKSPSSGGGGGDSVLSSESTLNGKASEASTGTPRKNIGSPDFCVSKQQSNNSHRNTNQQQQLLLPKSPPTNDNMSPQEDGRQWDEMFQRLKASRLVFGSSSMAGRFRGDSEMAQWVAAQRHAFKRGVLALDRQRKLESIQFVFHTPFNMSTAPATTPAGNSRKSPSAISSLANDTGGASDLSESDCESASQSMRTQEKNSKALNKTLSNLMKGARTWRDNFDLLVAYKQQYGDCNVPIRFKPDQRLGEWVHYVRLQMHGLSDEQRAMLDAIGFDFDHLEEDRIWNKSFHILKEYQAKGNFLLRPEDFTHVDSKFKNWVKEQRECYKAGELPGKRLAKLNSICFFWETEGYNHNYPAPATNNHTGSSQNVAQTPSNSHYNAKMPGNSHSNQMTGSTLSNQMPSNKYNNAQMPHSNHNNTNMNHSQMISGNAPQISVNQKKPHQVAGYQGPERIGWIQFYLSLVDFKNLFGHTEVPYDEDPQLYQWAAFQKMRKAYLLDHERKLLEDIGFRFHGDPAPAPKPAPTAAHAPTTAPVPTPAPPKQSAKSGTEGSSALLAAAMAWDPKTSPKRTPKWLSPRRKTKRAKIK